MIIQDRDGLGELSIPRPSGVSVVPQRHEIAHVAQGGVAEDPSRREATDHLGNLAKVVEIRMRQDECFDADDAQMFEARRGEVDSIVRAAVDDHAPSVRKDDDLTFPDAWSKQVDRELAFRGTGQVSAERVRHSSSTMAVSALGANRSSRARFPARMRIT